jgi:hypothetical protein
MVDVGANLVFGIILSTPQARHHIEVSAGSCAAGNEVLAFTLKQQFTGHDIMKKSLAAIAFIVASLPLAALAGQTFGDWTVENDGGRCTAYTKPVGEQTGHARPSAFLSIVNVPSEGVKSSVAFVLGEDGAGKAGASAMVDNDAFELLTFDKAAFAASGSPEAQLIASMKKAGKISVSWKLADGSTTADSYSLKGFSAAKSQIDRDCR